MTFDEAIEELDGCVFVGMDTNLVEFSDALYFIKQLRQKYESTVEMTKEQYDYIVPLIQEGKELGATFTEFWEIYKFTGASKKIKPAFDSQEQAMQVWLNPETIRVAESGK